MQISIHLYPFLILSSVLGFHKGLIKFILGAFVLMDCVKCFKHLTLDYEIGCGFFLFGSFKQVTEFLTVFLLLCFGLKLLFSDWFWVFYRLMYDFIVKLVELENGFCSKNVLDKKHKNLTFSHEGSNPPLLQKMEENGEKSNLCVDSDSETSSDSEEDSESYSSEEDDGKGYCSEEDDEFEVSKLKRMLKIERHRVNQVRAELEKERASSATAAEEAMAMILRLQNEKCLIEMESSQFRRLAEEKQIHDQAVIQSLQWLVWRHESERSLLEDQLTLCRRKLNRISKNDEYGEGEEKGVSSFNGNIFDALENVFYSSRDANL